MWFARTSVLCFEASYALALLLEVIRLVWPRPWLRVLSLVLGGAGLFAHTLLLAFQHLSLGSQYGSMLFLAWIVAVFYLYGAMHHRRWAWGVFVLPVVLGLIFLAGPPEASDETPWREFLGALRGDNFWGLLHGGLLLLAAVGVCVGFISSVMYLIQSHRLKTKAAPRQGLQLPSLEWLEATYRLAINLAFPLLTAGMIVGIALLWQKRETLRDWTDPRILTAAGLWLVFAILLYLRYGLHLRGRREAVLMITAFALLLVTLASSHTVQGGRP